MTRLPAKPLIKLIAPALAVLLSACAVVDRAPAPKLEAGARWVVLCDTNGGMLPSWMGDVVSAAGQIGVDLGIHCHNDTGCAVANTLAAVDARTHQEDGIMQIVNLFEGTSEDAQKDGAELLEPTTDTVTYSDGATEEVYGFDIPVPELDKEFDVALLGKKGVWYDHKVSVTNPVKVEE